MCSKMDTDGIPASFDMESFEFDFIEALLQEYEDEVKLEARWPTLLLQFTGRSQMWSLCTILGVNNKGVPGSACRLLEKYLSRHIRTFLQDSRDGEEWERYKDMMMSRLYLLMVSCIQLAAKMSDLLAPLSATVIRTTLMRNGVIHTKAEIVEMEFHVYSTLDFRIPLWTTLEMGEFLATQVGLKGPTMMEAVGLIINLSEFYRDQLELHMRCRNETCDTPGSSSSSSSKASLHNLHMCAGAVSAATRYMRSAVPDPIDQLATIIRTNFSYIKAISDTILHHIIPEKKHIPILKKRRLR